MKAMSSREMYPCFNGKSVTVIVVEIVQRLRECYTVEPMIAREIVIISTTSLYILTLMESYRSDIVIPEKRAPRESLMLKAMLRVQLDRQGSSICV